MGPDDAGHLNGKVVPMHRLLVSLAAAAAVLTAAAAGLFFVGGKGGVVSGSVQTVLTHTLWLAVIGRDPRADAGLHRRWPPGPPRPPPQGQRGRSAPLTALPLL